MFEFANQTNIESDHDRPDGLWISGFALRSPCGLTSAEAAEIEHCYTTPWDAIREESRKVDVFDASPTLENTDWDGLIVRVIKVTRATLVRRAKDRSWELRFDISFYVCSAPITARKAADAIRGHWSIENRNHYVRDVAMLEDASRIRKNPGIFARVRSFALNILRANGENNISQAMWHNVLDITRPLNYRFM